MQLVLIIINKNKKGQLFKALISRRYLLKKFYQLQSQSQYPLGKEIRWEKHP